MVTREEEPLNSPEKSKNRTLKEKLKYVKDNITVEPALACYVIPGVLTRLATQNLNLDKACRVNMGYGDTVCDALLAREGTMYQKQELAVQELIAGMEAWKNVILTAIPSILIIFLGAWSDRTRKRKICIILPMVGDLVTCLSNMLNVYYFYEIPVQVTMFFEALFPAITGGWVATYLGIFSYISDISSAESRTFRIGVATLCLTAGGPIGSALSGILLQLIGYYGVFSLSSLLYLFSISYGFFYVKDPETPVLDTATQNKSLGICGFLKDFFNIRHAKDTLAVAFKKGPNQRRLKLNLVFTCIFFIYGPAYGEFTMRYLFTRYRFNWDALKYSFYNTFFVCIHTCGALISITLFSRRLQWHDSVLCLISSGSKIVGGLATGLARNSLEMYLAVALEMLNATSYTALRSISSKLVNSDELGKITSIFNLMEVMTSLVFGPMYSWIYMVTLQTDAGFMYYISTVLTIAPICIYIWFFKQHRKACQTKNEETGKCEEKIETTSNSQNITYKNDKEAPLMNNIDSINENKLIRDNYENIV